MTRIARDGSMAKAATSRELDPFGHSTEGSPRGRIVLAAVVALLVAAVWIAKHFSTPGPELRTVDAKTALEVARERKLVLGESALFAGIPGNAKLSEDDVQRWLDDPKVHEPLDYQLPLWLRDSNQETSPGKRPQLTLAKIELGRQLFVERRIIGSGSFTCVECHHPTAGFSRATVFDERKNPPPVFNRIDTQRQFWDGRAESLEQQILFPLTNTQEMKSSPQKCEATLSAIPGYKLQFERIYGEVSYRAMTDAIASFERALTTGPGAYDYHRVKQELGSREPATLSHQESANLKEAEAGALARPMSQAALRGMKLFFSDRTQCASCHTGPNFTDEQFHNLGVGHNVSNMHESGEYAIPDIGRMHLTGDESDRGAFKTPTLRNLRDTTPYFHNGGVVELKAAVQFIVAGGEPNPNLSPLVRKLDLTDPEVDDLVAFLDSLQGDLPDVVLDHSPE